MVVFLFDIDGTLLLSGGAGLKSINRTFKKLYGETYRFETLKADGKTDPIILEELFHQAHKRYPSKEELGQVAEVYCQMMVEEMPLSPRFRLMPGAMEFLEALSDTAGVVMGLATGNLESMAWLKLKQAKMDHFFKFGGFGSDSKIRRELTELSLTKAQSFLQTKQVDQVFVVGDTIHDVDCAHHIGAKVIAVATGNTSAEELQARNPHYFFPTLVEARESLSLFL